METNEASGLITCRGGGEEEFKCSLFGDGSASESFREEVEDFLSPKLSNKNYTATISVRSDPTRWAISLFLVTCRTSNKTAFVLGRGSLEFEDSNEILEFDLGSHPQCP